MEVNVRLESGDKAPEFSAENQDGTPTSSADYARKKLALFFYPKAFTPGCTTEVCDFRDRHEYFTSRGYVILGVSPDEPDTLQRFKAEHSLPFDLIADPDNVIATAYGAYGMKKNYGREYMGIIRSTLLIDRNGTIEDAYYNVKATGHAERIAKVVAEQ